MTRVKKIVRNIIIIVALCFLFFIRSGLYLSPMSAHEHSERSIHFGPSKVVHVEDFDGGKYILGKYDKWVSCNTVNKALFFFWKFGSQVIGFENDKTKVLCYTWEGSYEGIRVYGIINDDKIKKVEITLNNGETFKTTKFYDDLFLFSCSSNNSDNLMLKNIRAYNSDDKVIFEEER